ncbi:unnamed protein product, partial [Prunus brigantina]
MPRIHSKRLPLRLNRSCTDVLNPSLVYGYEYVMLLVCCSFCHWLLSLCFQMADIVKEQWIQIQRLEQALHITKVNSLATDVRLNALEEEVRLLWAASRKYNFNVHVLESKAQDAEDRLETVASQAQKMADIVTEQWIQIQRLEQALHITQVSFFCLKLASGSLFAKFISFAD